MTPNEAMHQDPVAAKRSRSMIRQALSVPNQLTMLRLLMLPFVLISMIYGRHDVAFWLFLLAAVTDGIDGLVARHFNQKTLLGAYLDPIADKLLLSSCFIVQALIGAIPLWATVLVLSRDVVIIATVLVVTLTTDIRSFPPSRLGKINTAVQIATMFSVLTHNYLQMFWTERITGALILATAGTVLLSSVDYALAISRRLQQHHGPPPRS
jgi:cardiolipin synthase (CMP-forming)